MTRHAVRITVILSLWSAVARAQPNLDPQPPPSPLPTPVPAPEPERSPPPQPPPVERAPPPSQPPPPEITAKNPIAATLSRSAHNAAARRDCETATNLGKKVRQLDPTYYTAVFAADPVIAGCSAAPPVASDALGEVLYHRTGLGIAVGFALLPLLANTLPTQAETRLVVGYQSDSLMVGGRLAYQRSSTDSLGMSVSATSFAIGPSLRMTGARSANGRSELLLLGDVALGRISQSPVAGVSPPTTTRITLQAGPGVRYWLDRDFAVGVASGIHLERLSSGDTSTTITTIETSLDLTGVF